MKYFIDTEFIEGFHKPMFGKRRHFIDLISIGIVCEDGRTYSAISSEWRYKDADDWVKKNVIIPLYISTVSGDARNSCDADNFHYHGFGKQNWQIAKEVLEFMSEFIPGFDTGVSSVLHRIKKNPPEIYAYYADYDWVVFCSLYGRMIDLPEGLPMYCRDLKQMMDEKISPSEIKSIGYDRAVDRIKVKPGFPVQEKEHNALADANWNRSLYNFLTDTGRWGKI